MRRASFIILYYDQHMHHYFTIYHSHMFRHDYVILREHVVLPCQVTNSCIWNTCVTWQGTDYKLPEDGAIVSKHVGVW
jgi:hypothetical protein